MQRPTGVTILAVLAAIGGVLAILAGIALLGLSSTAATFAVPGIAGLAAIIGIVTIAVGVGDLVFAYGAWGLKPWAWMLGIAIEAIGIVISLLQFSGSTASSTLISIGIAAGIIYYLYRPHVRRAFGQGV